MRIRIASVAALTGVLLASPTRAAVPDVKAIDAATAVMTDCAKLADGIAALKVPAGHAKARTMKASNAQVSASAAPNPLAMVVPEDAHLDFMTQIEGQVAKLDECGKRYAKALKTAAALEATFSTVSDADAKPIMDNMTKYHDAQKALQTSVSGLSNDRQIQSYVHKTLKTYFLIDHRKGN